MDGVQLVFFGVSTMCGQDDEFGGQMVRGIRQGSDLSQDPQIANLELPVGGRMELQGLELLHAAVVSDGFIGDAEFQITVATPNGEQHALQRGAVPFQELGNIIWIDLQVGLTINLSPEYLGLYWFEFRLNGETLSRFPYFLFSPVPPDAE